MGKHRSKMVQQKIYIYKILYKIHLLLKSTRVIAEFIKCTKWKLHFIENKYLKYRIKKYLF